MLSHGSLHVKGYRSDRSRYQVPAKRGASPHYYRSSGLVQPTECEVASNVERGRQGLANRGFRRSRLHIYI